MACLGANARADRLNLSEYFFGRQCRACPAESFKFVESTTGVSEAAPRHLRHENAGGRENRHDGERRFVPYAAGAVLVHAGAGDRRQIERLTRRHHRRCQREGLVFSQPSPEDRHQPGADLIVWDRVLHEVLDQKANFGWSVFAAAPFFPDKVNCPHDS